MQKSPHHSCQKVAYQSHICASFGLLDTCWQAVCWVHDWGRGTPNCCLCEAWNEYRTKGEVTILYVFEWQQHSCRATGRASSLSRVIPRTLLQSHLVDGGSDCLHQLLLIAHICDMTYCIWWSKLAILANWKIKNSAQDSLSKYNFFFKGVGACGWLWCIHEQCELCCWNCFLNWYPSYHYFDRELYWLVRSMLRIWYYPLCGQS